MAPALAQVLNHALDKLVLVAPPREIADFRHELDADTRGMLVRAITQDLVNGPSEELHEQLGTVMVL